MGGDLGLNVSQLSDETADGRQHGFLVWRVAKASSATDCLGGEPTGGYVWMRVIADGRESEFAVFRSLDEAVRWATDRESDLLADGWQRVF